MMMIFNMQTMLKFCGQRGSSYLVPFESECCKKVKKVLRETTTKTTIPTCSAGMKINKNPGELKSKIIFKKTIYLFTNNCNIKQIHITMPLTDPNRKINYVQIIHNILHRNLDYTLLLDSNLYCMRGRDTDFHSHIHARGMMLLEWLEWAGILQIQIAVNEVLALRLQIEVRHWFVVPVMNDDMIINRIFFFSKVNRLIEWKEFLTDCSGSISLSTSTDIAWSTTTSIMARMANR